MAIISVRAGGFLEHLIRLAALFLVVGLVVVGFWKNSERNIERINARYGLSDETKTLSKAERERVQDFISALRKTYGIEARVQIRQGALDPPAQDGKTLFVGLSLDGQSAVVLLPPLMERALGPDFGRRLAGEMLPFHLGPGKNWPRGLFLALDLIQSRLAEPGVPAGPATAAKAAQTNATQKDHP